MSIWEDQFNREGRNADWTHGSIEWVRKSKQQEKSINGNGYQVRCLKIRIQWRGGKQLARPSGVTTNGGIETKKGE